MVTHDNTYFRMVNMQWGPLNVTFSYDSVASYLKDIDRGLGSITTIIQSSSVAHLGAVAISGPEKSFGLVKDARNYVTTYLFDTKGWLTELHTTELGTTDSAIQTWMRDDRSLIGTYISARGDTTTLAYDIKGNLTGVTLPGGTDRYIYSYTGLSRLASITDPLNRVTTFEYNQQGDVTTITNDLGDVTTLSYHLHGSPQVSNGLVKTITNPRGYTTSFNYWPDRRLKEVIDAKEGNTSFAYEYFANGPVTLHKTTVRDALGRLSSMVHDPRGRLLNATDNAGGRVTFTYNSIGEITSRRDQLNRLTSFVYDSRGWLTEVQENPDLSASALDRRATIYTYDVNGNVATVKNARDVVTSYSYDPVNRVNRVSEAYSYPSGLPTMPVLNHNAPLTQYAYDRNGNLLTVTLPNGTRTTYAYDARDRLITMIEADGVTGLQRASGLVWDKASNLLSVTDPRNVITSFLYDNLNRVKAIREAHNNPSTGFDALGHNPPITTITYDKNGNVWWVENARNIITSFVYDELDRRTKMIEAKGAGSVERQTTYAYDAVHNLTSMTNPRGVRSDFQYDNLNRLEKVTEGLYTPGAGLPALGHAAPFTLFAYDAASRLLSVTYPRDIATTFAYDALDRRVTAIEAWQTAVARTTQFQYDREDNLTGRIDPRGVGATFVYDALDRLASRTDAASGTGGLPALNHTSPITAYVYDIHSNLLGVKNPRDVWVSFTYDALDRRTEVIDTLNRRTTYVYDAADNVLSFKNARNVVTSFAYDALYRVARVLDAYSAPTGLPTMPALGHAAPISTYLYDITSNVIAFVDPLDKRTSYSYDALNRRTETEDARNGRTTVGYDAAGNVTLVRDAMLPANNVTTYEYDGLDRRSKRTGPTGLANTYAYDLASRLVGTTDRLLRRRDYQFDDLDRVTTQIWKSDAGAAVDTLTYKYDANDNLLEAYKESVGLVSYAYDGLNRRATQRDVWALLLTFTYDKTDNRIKVEDSKSGVVSSVYDTLNRLQTRELTTGGTKVLKVDVTYSPVDRVETVTRSYWNSSAYQTAGTSSYLYDALERTANIQHKDGAGSSLALYTYTLDKVSRLTREQLTGPAPVTATDIPYSYDATNQLTGDGQTTWQYDLNGNRTGANYGTPAAGNRLTTATIGGVTWTYEYDAEGNLTKKTRGPTAETWTFGYDHNNQMIWAHKAATDGGTPILEAYYTYDALGRRVEKSIAGGAYTRFAYDDTGHIWADLDDSNNVLTRYVHGDAVDELIARVSGAGTLEWYLTDRMGSVRGITSNTGTLAEHVNYDGFGNPTTTVSGTFGRFRWTGRESDDETGFQYNRLRYYMADVGRWTTEDPIGFGAGDPNLNRYVGNGPTNAVDPHGLHERVLPGWQQDYYFQYLWDQIGSQRPSLLVPSTPEGNELDLLGQKYFQNPATMGTFGGFAAEVEKSFGIQVPFPPPRSYMDAQLSKAKGCTCQQQSTHPEMRGITPEEFERGVQRARDARLKEEVQERARQAFFNLEALGILGGGKGNVPVLRPGPSPVRSWPSRWRRSGSSGGGGSRDATNPPAPVTPSRTTSGLSVVPRPGMTSRVVTAPNGNRLTVWGQAENASSKTPGHAEAMNSLVSRLAQTGEYEYVCLQRSWRIATGYTSTSWDKPDVIGVRRNGRVDAWEVKSVTDNVDALRQRLRQGMDSLPSERQGSIDVIPPEPPGP